MDLDIAVVLALGAAFLNTSNDLIYRSVALKCRNTGPLPFYLVSSVSSLVVAILLNTAGSQAENILYFARTDLIYGTLIGMLSFITYILYLSRFSGQNTTLSVTIYRMNLIPGIILATLFLGETLTFKRASAIFLCVLSLFVLSHFKTGNLKKDKYFILSIFAFFGGGIINAVNKSAMSQGGNSFKILIVRFVVVSILAVLLVVVKRSARFDKRAVKYAIMSGTVFTLTIYLILEAMKTGDVSLVLPVTQLSFALVVIAGWVIYKEKLNYIKVTGICLAILSVILVN